MANAEQFRHAVEPRSRREPIATRESDPGAAPLGTDDEAAGQSYRLRRRPLPPYGPPQPGDRIADGDPMIGVRGRSEEDNRAPASAPPDWRLWGLTAALLVCVAIVATVMAA
ncbi:hypothetical protein ABLE93_03525 [Xanthobacter sp. KR7-65]|uniref:hypothetical protein n=1 Tax=Xanthobacter sp. KR7-65 TaxID=3156612 RepID=UPI0032B4A73C